MAAYDEDLMRGLAQLGPDGALQTLRAIGAQLNARDRTGGSLSIGQRQFFSAVEMSRASTKPTKALTASQVLAPKVKKAESTVDRRYSTWHLFLSCIRLLDIPETISDENISKFMEEKIASGCTRYNAGMARSNILRIALGPIKQKHNTLIDELMAHACAEASCTHMTKQRADSLLTREWVDGLDSRFDVLWTDSRAACAGDAAADGDKKKKKKRSSDASPDRPKKKVKTKAKGKGKPMQNAGQE